MKSIKQVLLIGAGLLVSLNLLHAQAQLSAQPAQSIGEVQSAPPDSIVQLTAEAQGLELVSPGDVPRSGTFWVVTAENGVTAPWPCPPRNASLPTYAIADGQFIVDATGGQVSGNTRPLGLQAASSMVAAELAGLADSVVKLITWIQGVQLTRQMAVAFGMEAALTSPSGFAPMFATVDPAALYLEITNVSSGWSYLNLHNGTNQVYAIWSTTNLLTGWNVEMELWPTDTNCQPFMLQNFDRQNLFVRAEDWTGVDSNGDGVPDWWVWKYYHTLVLSATNLDSQGHSLLYDYTNNIAPNDVGRVPVLLSTLNVTDPVDIKWVAPDSLYVLSGSTATITEFDTNGNVVASLSGLGSNPSGFDVDAAGNVYVALTGGNQVWKFKPTTSSFIADTNFGSGGFIGAANGATGAASSQFNVPFDVAVSPDGGTISVSDSGNNRIQQFSTNGTFTTSFGSSGSAVGQFNSPKGLTYDSGGTLYVVDSGNNRVVLVQGVFIEGVTGTSGTAFGQFNSPLNISFGEHGVYVADQGNDRIQSFKSPVPHVSFSADWPAFRLSASASLNQPSAVVARDDDLTTEKFYVADTGNNRVRLYALAPEDLTPVWNSMTNHIAAGDISGAASYFSIASATNYLNMFQSIGTSNTISAISQIGALTPVYINDDRAEYYFTNTIAGQIITFPVEFDKENGAWKILEF